MSEVGRGVSEEKIEVDAARQQGGRNGHEPEHGVHAEARAQGALHPLVELTLTRLREFLREKEAVFWVFVFPVLLAFALGIAFRNSPPEKTRVAVEDTPAQVKGAPAPSEIVALLARSPDIAPILLPHDAAARALRAGKVTLIIRPTNDADTTRQTTNTGNTSSAPTPNPQPPTPTFTYRYDPMQRDSRRARLLIDDALQRELGRQDVSRATDEKVTEPGARYIDFLVPGLIGLNLMGSGMWGIGFAVVQARNRKLLKRFAATPMRRSHYLFSFMLSRMIFLALEIFAILGFARLAFGVTMHGNVLSFVLIALVGGMTFLGMGTLLAARPETVEGVSGLMNFAMLPMWLLSGTFFTSARFPQVLQPFIKALPLTALNDSLRAVMNEGAPLLANWSQLVVLIAWGLVSFVVALRIFRWK
ncbi:MAG TPA: ABC transporter permease [Pyrinomonadaceae bacterium]